MLHFLCAYHSECYVAMSESAVDLKTGGSNLERVVCSFLCFKRSLPGRFAYYCQAKTSF